MGPLGFLTGVVLGSAVSISAVLAMVLVVFLVASGDHPALLEEYAPLIKAIGLFGLLAGLAGAAFYALQRQHPWRWVAQAVMWAALAGVAWSYWPDPVA